MATRRSSSKARPARPRAADSQRTKAAADGPSVVRLARVAKGRKPQYFSDPAIDKLLSIAMTLAGELSVARDRIDTLERLLQQKRILAPGDVDAFEPGPEAARQRDARRAAYLDRVLRAVQSEMEEITGPGMPRSQEDVIAAVAE